MLDRVLDKSIGLLSLQGKARMLYREYRENALISNSDTCQKATNWGLMIAMLNIACLFIRLTVASFSPDTLLLHPLLFHVSP